MGVPPPDASDPGTHTHTGYRHSEAAARRGEEPCAEVEERGFGGDEAEAHRTVLFGEAALPLGPSRICLLRRPPEGNDF